MNLLKCNLTNCFGIEGLDHEFDFSKDNAIAIYARNGLMKTSFAKTFKKIQDGKDKEIGDVIFGLEGMADIIVDGNKIKPNQIFVINSFESFYESNSLTSLLINDEIKLRITKVLKLKDRFLKKLEKDSGLKISKTYQGKKIDELELTILNDFEFDEKSILLNLVEFDNKELEYNCGHIKYNSIFDKTAINKIQKEEFQNKIEEFCRVSDKIYKEYNFLDKGNLTLPKLKNIAKLLEKDRFFIKDNYLHLAGGYEIDNTSKLSSTIEEVESKIKAEPVFREIEKLLSDSKGIILRDIIEKNPEIISYLKTDKLNSLKIELWLSYIRKSKEEFDELLSEYNKLEEDISNIDFNDTEWKNALNIFEERFTVPYQMNISNIKGAIIGESIPRVEFSFEKNGEIVSLERSELEDKNILSQGEKRALYLLNIIFDIEKIKKSKDNVLFIIDDIADSFDYKNKYAIIEYLYEMSNIDNFKLLILSHNFDFYRTVSSRLNIRREARLCAEINNNRIVLKQEKYQKQPFKSWKNDLNLIHVLALIPFVRNIVEYKSKNCDSNEDYIFLTKLLHQKKDSKKITFKKLLEVLKKHIEISNYKEDIELNSSVIEKLYEVSDDIRNENIELEYKVVLAMAIRHKAEEYMFTRLENYKGNISWKKGRDIKMGSVDEFFKSLKSCGNQTRVLSDAISQFDDKENKKIIDEVNIMTPENIHLNSFMYEPLLDMDINELLTLYKRIKSIHDKLAKVIE